MSQWLERTPHDAEQTHKWNYILEPLKVYGAILETSHLFYQGKHPTCKPTVQLFSRPFCGTIVQTELQFERRIKKKNIYMCEKLRQ